ncbi:MAG: class I SAM-dependent methyltransferase [Nitrospirae bacterium]|nr:class I SAM-dependent methyltransferase [Nitrospirota bacterium]
MASNRLPWSWFRKKEAGIVSSLIGKTDGLYAMDLGCGAGFYTRLLLSCGGVKEVTAVDISREMINQLPKANVTGIVGNAETIQLNRKFDIIICAGILEFTSNPQRVLQNAKNHMNDRGIMVVLAPVVGFWGRLYRFYHKLHGLNVQLFDSQQLRVMAENGMWKVIKIQKLVPFSLIMKLETK